MARAEEKQCSLTVDCICESCRVTATYIASQSQLTLQEGRSANLAEDIEAGNVGLKTGSCKCFAFITMLCHIVLIICNLLLVAAIVMQLMITPLPDEITLNNRTYTIDRYKILSVARKVVPD